ncbi:MAG TPA: Na(+)-translocating NADH-quinone reductase subunit A [Maritimibacter sp.]|nr:Na(+)-translocating NADH-quinone reductase subunit A [Maritimibacter sp.]
MHAFSFPSGLDTSPEQVALSTCEAVRLITEEAALTPAAGEEIRLETVVSEGHVVDQGQPIATLHGSTTISIVAPMAGRIASMELRPGRRLVQIVLFRERGGDRHVFNTKGAEADPGVLRNLLQQSGIWRLVRSRPFGAMPRVDEHPAAIFVMASDSRPGSPDPRLAIQGREDAFERGLSALTTLTDGPVFLVASKGKVPGDDLRRVTRLTSGRLHPMGLAGLHVHRRFPATPKAPIWDVQAEVVANLGDLLATGLLPETLLVSLTGTALREPRLVHCQAGADLRGLSREVVEPGPHVVLSGSVLDGASAHWLRPRDRQASVIRKETQHERSHWFRNALRTASRPLPIIPTAALNQSFGGNFPAAAFVRALAAGDIETATKFGALSFLEEDLSLADFVTAADPPLSRQLRVLLDRVQDEEFGQ